jgi:AraC-like DNA-binding protein
VSFTPQARYAALSGYGALSDSLGLDWAPLMRSVGLDPAGLAVQDRWIPAAAVARLLEISAVASGRDDFGLRLVEFRRLANLGPLALVIREEPDVRSVLEMLIRYEHTYNQAISIRLSEANGVATIRMDLELGEPAGTSQATELAVGTLHHVHRQLHGTRWQPLSVCFSHPAPADISTHLRIFGHVMQFQREFAGIVLRAGDLAAPNKIADPLLRPYAHQFLDTIGPPAEVTTVARVRAFIEALLPTGHCSIVQVARSLGVDRRTVQRRLADSGETFSSLLDAVRAELAERLVPNPRRSLTEIAEELGFSEPSAFSRWFRRRFGCSPSEWRGRSQVGAQQPPASRGPDDDQRRPRRLHP